ncbi:hypothetical protein [Prevotella sp. 10(H)]|uniref:hypothetical protein n=1 Tax=Prevotella sp. 10(H) TaxID=1158294 RepID=UPI0004A6F558|nr:hypothetical protein [Prevotella sp. 10(H)]
MIKHLLFFVLLSFSLASLAQEPQVEIIKPAEGKSMVYFIRTSSVGALINFSIYDGEELVGKLKPGKFVAYECEPGYHVFIGKSENTDYVEANLEAGKVYVIDAQAKMGALKARIKLSPLDKNSKKHEKEKKNFLKLIAKNKGEIVSIEDETEVNNEYSDASPGKTMKKFQEKKEKNDKINQLTTDMYIDTDL